jgi:chromosome partitioning protein
MRIAVANLKGGTGKTTTAVHLAIGLARTGRTLLVDGDPQASALAWSEDAADLPMTVIAWPTRDLARRVAQVAGDYTHIVIDTPPGHEAIVRQALMAADTLIVTLAPSLMEVGRLGPTFELAAEVEALHPIGTRVLLTRVRSGTTSAREARALLQTNAVPSFVTEIHLRESYAHAYGTVPLDLGEYEGVLGELGDGAVKKEG